MPEDKVGRQRGQSVARDPIEKANELGNAMMKIGCGLFGLAFLLFVMLMCVSVAG